MGCWRGFEVDAFRPTDHGPPNAVSLMATPQLYCGARNRYDRYDRERPRGKDRDIEKRPIEKSDSNAEAEKLDEKELQAIRVYFYFKLLKVFYS